MTKKNNQSLCRRQAKKKKEREICMSHRLHRHSTVAAKEAQFIWCRPGWLYTHLNTSTHTDTEAKASKLSHSWQEAAAVLVLKPTNQRQQQPTRNEKKKEGSLLIIFSISTSTSSTLRLTISPLLLHNYHNMPIIPPHVRTQTHTHMASGMLRHRGGRLWLERHEKNEEHFGANEKKMVTRMKKEKRMAKNDSLERHH